MKTEALNINNKLFTCCGNPTVNYTPNQSLEITRYLTTDETTNQSVRQTFVPKRYMQGTYSLTSSQYNCVTRFIIITQAFCLQPL